MLNIYEDICPGELPAFRSSRLVYGAEQNKWSHLWLYCMVNICAFVEI